MDNLERVQNAMVNHSRKGRIRHVWENSDLSIDVELYGDLSQRATMEVIVELATLNPSGISIPFYKGREIVRIQWPAQKEWPYSLPPFQFNSDPQGKPKKP